MKRLVNSQNFFSPYLTQEDMSRFGRNYLEVGFYTEIQFPSKGVRFIAINNNVDSANPTDNDFTPFLNIMNEWYAKDTSNKNSCGVQIPDAGRQAVQRQYPLRVQTDSR